jgi:uncharacterized membrane protein
MTLESAKYMGGVGSLLLVIGGIALFSNPFFALLGLVGFILILVALNGMASFYGDRGIFNNALYAFIAGIIGAVAFIGTLIVALLSFVANLPSWAKPYVDAQDWQGLSTAFQQHITDFSSFWNTFSGIVLTLVVALIVLFVFLVVAFFFFRRSLGRLSTKTHVGLFGTAGLLMLIGAILTIILIGFLLIWIGLILLTIAFFSVREAAPTPAQPTSTIPSASTQ